MVQMLSIQTATCMQHVSYGGIRSDMERCIVRKRIVQTKAAVELELVPSRA